MTESDDDDDPRPSHPQALTQPPAPPTAFAYSQFVPRGMAPTIPMTPPQHRLQQQQQQQQYSSPYSWAMGAPYMPLNYAQQPEAMPSFVNPSVLQPDFTSTNPAAATHDMLMSSSYFGIVPEPTMLMLQQQHHPQPVVPVLDLPQLQSSLVEVYNQIATSGTQAAAAAAASGTPAVPSLSMQGLTRLLQITQYLGDHAVALGIVDDAGISYETRLQFWRLFNRTWLNLLARAAGAFTRPQLDEIAHAIITLADRVQRYGLVDYEMGVWEDRIVDWVMRIADNMPEAHHA
ncbi:uncharacterized protein V1518DRAFT_136869 [Limtongia smithiae]|uniref:uncharacterized protein n=1 Tax=Limtongia smithiae TaxID=1125753 RepID=UPI0034CD0A5D